MDAAPRTEGRTPVAKSNQARVVEVFSSIQGEGPHVGRRHIFVRLFACNLRCTYCDTPESLEGNPPARLEQTPGRGDFLTLSNPLSAADLMEAVTRLAIKSHDAVSFTGGEPLLQHELIAHLAPRVHDLGLSVYLETNGTLPDALRQVIGHIDTVAMDIKLPETLKDGRDHFPAHAKFLEVALAKEVFCKLVLPAQPDLSAISRAAEMVASVSPAIPFIIQPVTPFGDVTDAPSQERVLETFDLVKSRLADVRVIPQTHKMVGLR